MNRLNQYFDLIQAKPIYQGIASSLIALVIIVFILIGRWIKLLSPDPESIWMITTAILLFYILFNCLFSFQTKDKMEYYAQSIYTYVALIVSGILVAQFITGQTLFETDSHPWIIMVFSMVYLVFISILNLIRKIVEIALRQEKNLENEP
ncbi:MAG TPA: hypothetical protein PK006_07730 [Saprospiraceae bacterium]|nr:hypothetical protein [Saprospiraceae bacterium]